MELFSRSMPDAGGESIPASGATESANKIADDSAAGSAEAGR